MRNTWNAERNIVATVLIVLSVSLFSYPVIAAPTLTDIDAKSILQNVFRDYNFIIPVGRVEILAVNDIGQDRGKHVFAPKFMKTLEIYNTLGLITMVGGTNLVGALGDQWGPLVRIYNVSITDKGKNNSVGNLNNGDYILGLGKRKIIRIVGNKYVNYEGGKEGRIVLGVYEFTPTGIGREYASAAGEQFYKNYKFKALLEFDPFKGKYIFKSYDWGHLDRDNYETSNLLWAN